MFCSEGNIPWLLRSFKAHSNQTPNIELIEKGKAVKYIKNLIFHIHLSHPWPSLFWQPPSFQFLYPFSYYFQNFKLLHKIFRCTTFQLQSDFLMVLNLLFFSQCSRYNFFLIQHRYYDLTFK